MQNLDGNPDKDTTPLGVRHCVSRLNSRFHGGDGDFADYIRQMRDMISRVRSGEDAIQLQKTIDGNTPFELRPDPGFPAGRHKLYRRGVVLIHGLTDSPYSMRHLGEFFRQQGFRVMAVLLPGHGTQPGDLLRVTWQEWAKCVAFAVEQMAIEADEIYLGGYSAGAALSVHHSLHDARVRGLFLFSPAMDINHRAAFAWVHKLYSWLVPKACWISLNPDLDHYKYESLAKNGAAQLFALCLHIDGLLAERRVSLPIFTAASLEDTTVIPAATLEFMATETHPLNHLLLYSASPDEQPGVLHPGQVELVDSRIPAQRILSLAHTALLQPCDDPHYGLNGDYRNCVHYYQSDRNAYDACMEHIGELNLGENSASNLAQGLLQRLTCNPHYEQMLNSLHTFIERLP